MRRVHHIRSAFIGLVLLIGIPHVQGAIVPFQASDSAALIPNSSTRIVEHMRVPLAVPSFTCATHTEEWIGDLLPASEAMYQDRHWGYWLGYSAWNGYSFLLTGKGPYWGRYWGYRTLSDSDTSAATVPEPASMILFGLAGVWMVTRKRRWLLR